MMRKHSVDGMMRPGWCLVLLAAALCLTGVMYSAAIAAENPGPDAQPAAPAAPTDVKTYGDWVVRCFPIKAPARCDLFQATLDKATQRRIVSVSIAYAPSTNFYAAKIIVPLEVRLDAGVVVTADKFTSAAMAYTRCEADGCYMEDRIDAALIKNLDGAKSGSIMVKSVPGGRVILPLSLRGFSDALSAMKSLAIEKDQQR
jgi:invasion protein IalB